MEGVLIVGLLFLWMVLWVMLVRHERRRARKGLSRHGALRMLIAAAALLTVLFILGSATLLFTMHGSLLQQIRWDVVRLYVGSPFLVALIVLWFTMRRSAPAS
jgi:hypothetical protein